jgi:L-aminopeptidase/D-esterase-like protein
LVTDIPRVLVGHWTDEAARTGCTAVLFPGGATASGEVRGGAPATREFDLLAPERLVGRIDAVVLSGGSAFGLDACSGAVAWCEEQGLGLATSAGPVPIVVGACIYDLAEGESSVRPGAPEGYRACAAAAASPVATGRVGAGAGATVGKWRGVDAARPGGLGVATRSEDEVVVSALIVVNAYGDVVDPGGRPLGAGGANLPTAGRANPFENSTVGLVVTNAGLDKTACLLVAQSGHDGLARAIEPAHTRFDGDALVAAAVGGVEASLEQVRVLAARAVADAVRVAVA